MKINRKTGWIGRETTTTVIGPGVFGDGKPLLKRVDTVTCQP